MVLYSNHFLHQEFTKNYFLFSFSMQKQSKSLYYRGFLRIVIAFLGWKTIFLPHKFVIKIKIVNGVSSIYCVEVMWKWITHKPTWNFKCNVSNDGHGWNLMVCGHPYQQCLTSLLERKIQSNGILTSNPFLFRPFGGIIMF